MKLADIKLAVEHAAIAEFKRSFYNVCAVCSESLVRSVFETEFKSVFEDDDNDKVSEN